MCWVVWNAIHAFKCTAVQRMCRFTWNLSFEYIYDAGCMWPCGYMYCTLWECLYARKTRYDTVVPHCALWSQLPCMCGHVFCIPAMCIISCTGTHLWTCIHVHVTCKMLCLPVFLFTPDDDILDDINAHLASNAAHMTTDHVRAQMHVLASSAFNRNNFTHEHCTVHKVHVHVHMYTCTYVYYSYYLCICLSSKLNIVLKLNTSHLICMHMYVQYM